MAQEQGYVVGERDGVSLQSSRQSGQLVIIYNSNGHMRKYSLKFIQLSTAAPALFPFFSLRNKTEVGD